jgi:hypothetical protein
MEHVFYSPEKYDACRDQRLCCFLLLRFLLLASVPYPADALEVTATSIGGAVRKVW